MATITHHGRAVSTVFDLVGRKENDITAALGFALSRCPQLLAAVVKRFTAHEHGDHDLGDAQVGMEVREDLAGRTDLELRVADALYIVEAKQGWLLPTVEQLAQYAGRVHRHGGAGGLLTLSQASPALAALSVPAAIDGIRVTHLPWRDVLTDIAAAQRNCRGHERFWLDELTTYLKEVIRVRPVEDSWTYCVVLNDDAPSDGTVTFKEFVTDHFRYFHPYGVGGWPTETPNFMAFRWDGAVQRIHRVIKAEVVSTLAERWPYMRNNPDAARPHAVYELGPQLPPTHPIPTGRNYRAARLWVLLDQLQTARTLAEALSGTKALTESGS